MQRNDLRRYILLRPVAGQAAGTARLENYQGRYGIHIHVRNLPDAPVWALLLSGGVQTGAVTDLGLMRSVGEGQAALSRENLLLHSRVYALALATDWPEAQLLMCGWGHSQPDCTVWQVQDMVRSYLAVPAADSAPAPLKWPENAPKPSVLRLRARVST